MRILGVERALEFQHGDAGAEHDRGLGDVLAGIGADRLEGSPPHVHVDHLAGVQPADHRVAVGHGTAKADADPHAAGVDEAHGERLVREAPAQHEVALRQHERVDIGGALVARKPCGVLGGRDRQRQRRKASEQCRHGYARDQHGRPVAVLTSAWMHALRHSKAKGRVVNRCAIAAIASIADM